MHLIRNTFAALLLVLPGQAMAVETGEPQRAIKSIGILYEMDAPLGLSGLSLSIIQREDEGYAYETYSRGLGLARLVIASNALESTRFDLDSAGFVQPDAYLCRSCEAKKDGLVKISYDWRAHRALYSEKDEQQEFELRPRAMDRKAWEIQTMLDLGAGRPLTVQPTLEAGKLKLYDGQLLGEETLSTPAGEFQTVKYRRQREGSENFQFIWYARELGWLPARWEIWRKDKRTVIIEAKNYGWGEDAALAMRQKWLDK